MLFNTNGSDCWHIKTISITSDEVHQTQSLNGDPWQAAALSVESQAVDVRLCVYVWTNCSSSNTLSPREREGVTGSAEVWVYALYPKMITIPF